MSFLIFSDLDGTLLSYNNYSFHEAIEALNYIKEYNIPCIIATSKTFKESVEILNTLGLREPFIVENGGSIFFPCIYHNMSINFGEPFDNYRILCVGIKRQVILDFVNYIVNFLLMNYPIIQV